MTASESQACVFAATPAAGREARHWLAGVLKRWGYDAATDGPLVDDALLCIAELATNVVLHTRASFEVFVRRQEGRLHLEVIDDRPEQLPLLVPLEGTAADITAFGTTGRGLQIVAALSRRWGVTTSEHAKSVWAELAPGTSALPTEPIVVIGHRSDPGEGRVRLEFLSLPVRTTVASAVQVEEIVRELQLTAVGGSISREDVEEVYALLDDSARPRLSARHAALRAAARGERRFDLQLDTSLASLLAYRQLNDVLAKLPESIGGAAAGPGEEIVTFRQWLEDEGTRQVAGEAPRVCPLPG